MFIIENRTKKQGSWYAAESRRLASLGKEQQSPQGSSLRDISGFGG